MGDSNPWKTKDGFLNGKQVHNIDCYWGNTNCAGFKEDPKEDCSWTHSMDPFDREQKMFCFAWANDRIFTDKLDKEKREIRCQENCSMDQQIDQIVTSCDKGQWTKPINYTKSERLSLIHI